MSAGTLERGHEDEVLRASRVSRFSLTSPRPAVTAGAMAGTAALVLLLLWAGRARLEPTQAAAVALLGLLAPAYAAALAGLALMRKLSGTITWGRVFVLGVTDLAVVFLFALCGSLVPWPSGDTWIWALLAGTAFAASVNMLVLGATSHPRLSVAALPGLLIPAGAAAVLWSTGLADDRQAALAAAFSALFLGSAAVWARFVVSPFRRGFRENGLALLQSLLDAWAGWSANEGEPARGTLAMESFFARHGADRAVRFTAARFVMEDGKEHLWFLPDLHPGPYADLGGSDLPAKAAEALGGPARSVATFHGATTHDENPCRRADLAAVLAKVAPALGGAPESALATASRRVRGGGVTLLAQWVGHYLVLTHTRAPASSDDVDWPVGLAVEQAASARGALGVALLDAHNAVAADLGQTKAGSRQAQRLERLASAVAAELERVPREPLRVGVGRATLAPEDMREFAVGRQGIVATVVAAGAHKTAYVLIDGNNLKAGLRENILAAVGDTVDRAEVLTTDNHAVNTTMGADNEVGSRGDNRPLIDEAARAVREAVTALAPARVSWARQEVPGVRVFGPGLTVRMSEAINEAVSRMVPGYATSTAAALAACCALALLAP